MANVPQTIGLTIAAAALVIPLPAIASLAEEPARTYTPGTPAEIPIRVKEIAPGFFMLTGRGANSLVAATPAGLVQVDSKLMYRSVREELRKAMQGRTEATSTVLTFLTHHHADHSGGGEFLLEDGSRLVGHERLVPILAEYVTRIAPRNPAAPSETFASHFSDEVGGLQIEAHHWGPGHTAADIAVYFPEARIVAAGDMVYGSGELAVDYVDGHGSLLGMLDRIDDLLALDFLILVPGHGDNVLTREEVVLYRDRLGRLVARGLTAVRAGAGVGELREAMRSDDLGFRLVGHFWTEERYLAPMHAELTQMAAAQEGKPD